MMKSEIKQFLKEEKNSIVILAILFCLIILGLYSQILLNQARDSECIAIGYDEYKSLEFGTCYKEGNVLYVEIKCVGIFKHRCETYPIVIDNP